MAQEHNALKYGSQISRAAARAYGLGDEETGLSRLGETLQLVADLWSRPEWAFLRNEKLWMVNPSQAGVAAEFAQVGIRNPTGSGLVVVVDRLWMRQAISAFVWEWRIAASSAVDATANPNSRDTRNRPAASSNVQTVSIAHSSAARLGFLLGSSGHPNSSESRLYPADIVLSPGFDFYVGPDTVNQAANVTFVGRERRAFPGELERA